MLHEFNNLCLAFFSVDKMEYNQYVHFLLHTIKSNDPNILLSNLYMHKSRLLTIININMYK